MRGIEDFRCVGDRDRAEGQFAFSFHSQKISRESKLTLCSLYLEES